MRFLKFLERKFGRYAIPHIIKYVLVLYGVGTAIGLLVPGFYERFLILDFDKVARGEVWRIVTFIMQPYGLSASGTGVLGFLFFAIEIYLYHMIGSALEYNWGTFRFNLYVISGVLFNVIAAFILYLAFGIPYYFGLQYILQSLFLAFAVLYPDMRMLLMYVIPVKIKWLGYMYAAIMGYNVIVCFASGNVLGYAQGTAILVAMANFLLFFIWSRKANRISPAHAKRRREFKKQTQQAVGGTLQPRHRCAICGRTEQDNPNLEFRFCSKCEGNYEYCSDHLFSHEHVKKS